MVSEEPTAELAAVLVPDQIPGCCQFCADQSRQIQQHTTRLVNVATQQELAQYGGRLNRLTAWYIAGWVLIVLMILAGVLLQHFWH